VKIIDPIQFGKMCWPNINFYKEQKEIIYSVMHNEETFVPAGNELGKDFVSAFITLWFFCSRRPCKITTTSPQAAQLADVLWGELRRLIDESQVRLPIFYTHMKIRQVRDDGSLEPRSELVGRVVQKGESLLGRHVSRGPNGEPMTMALFDEASGMEDTPYEASDTWAHRKLIIGNPYPCDNFFKKGVRDGDLKHPTDKGYFRKVIRIKAEQSPNVRLAQAEIKAGKKPSGREIVPGVVRYNDYVKRREIWDPIRQCVGLDAEFYEGSDALLYPPEWINIAETRFEELRHTHRVAKTIGVDPAEGGDNTCWTICDEHGIIDQVSMRTPDTSVIPGNTIALMNAHSVQAGNVYFDRGGGGKQHADALRAKGYNVKTVAFGEGATPEKKRGMTILEKRKLEDEDRYIFKNRRAEMYGLLRQRLDPGNEFTPQFAMPKEYTELRMQMSRIPLLYDGEGRMYLPSKSKKNKDSKETTLIDIIGHSPDELDSLVLAVYGLKDKSTKSVIQPLFKG